MSEFERRGFKDDRVIFEKHVRGRYRIIIIIDYIQYGSWSSYLQINVVPSNT